MLRGCLSSILMMALVMATSVPTAAAGGFDPYFGGPDHGFDAYRRSGELAAGVYLRVPFSGNPRRSVSETRFGLSLGARLPSVDRPEISHTLADMPKLVDLSIGLTGKDSLRLNGVSIAGTPRLYADEDGGWGTGPWIFAGFTLLGGALLLAAVIS